MVRLFERTILFIKRYRRRPIMESIRINKFISQCGFCSRREADRIIEKGEVLVNGEPAKMGTKVLPSDEVKIQGVILTKEEPEVIIAFHKPAGIVCTTSKKDKDNIIDYIDFPQRIYPIGRLDKDSTGLILLTNNGQLMDDILRGSNYHEKEYIVTVDKPLTSSIRQAMEQGVPILDTMTRPCQITQQQGTTFHMILTQGLNRQIRRMCEYFGYRVRKLHRVRIMNIYLQDLPEGKWRFLSQNEIRQLKELAGKKGTKICRNKNRNE